jgi:hypothetical protein
VRPRRGRVILPKATNFESMFKIFRKKKQIPE